MANMNFTNILLLFILILCSISCKKGNKYLTEITIEFENEQVKDGMLHKFDDYFETTYEENDKYDNDDDYEENLLETDADDEAELNHIKKEMNLISTDFNSAAAEMNEEMNNIYDEEEYYEEEYIYPEAHDELHYIAKHNEGPSYSEENTLSTEFKNLAETMCLLTVVSKETSIFITETVKF